MPEINMTFDEVAALYHRIRPRYPEELFERIGRVTGAGRGHRVLELGSGTGIATRPMLERGWSVDCVEPGASLAAIARDDLQAFPDLRMFIGTFEEYADDAERYDAIVSATAFHWIPPELRYVKSHRLLKPGGYLAVLQYQHVAGGDIAMFDEIQDCYLAHMPGTKRRETLRAPAKRTQSEREMRRSGLFDIVDSLSMVVIERYSRHDFLDLISTYSGHRMLEPAQLAALQSCIGEVIDRGGGEIRKAYAHELVIGKRREAMDGA